jgi:hypothetical protein
MHEGYFVGRKELIGWIQQHFQPSDLSNIPMLTSSITPKRPPQPLGVSLLNSLAAQGIGGRDAS